MSEQQNFEEEQAKKKAQEETEPQNALQFSTVLVVGLALILILAVGLFMPLRDKFTLEDWLKRAQPEAVALSAEIPPELEFTDAEYDPANRELVLYAYFLTEEGPIPAKTEVGRAPLPAGAHTDTFVNVRRLKDGVLFARRVSSGVNSAGEWEGLYVSESGLGDLEEYLRRDAGENAWYLLNVPQALH